MSYILDALKRADTERDRGQIPGLRSQPLPGTAAPARSRRPMRRVALWLSLGLLMAGLLAFGWWFARPHPTDAGAQPQPVAAVPPAPQVPPAAPAAPALAEPPTSPPAPLLAEASPAAAPILVPQAPPVAPAAAPTRPPSPVPEPAPAAVHPANIPASSPPSPPVGPATLAAVKITGSTYSANPAHRMLIVNGRVLQEGQEVSPGLKLEVIGPRSAVFNQQGVRYNVNY